MQKGIVIVSGGMDSSTLAYYLEDRYPYEWHFLSFDYGQRHIKELQYAIELAERLDAKHSVISLVALGEMLSVSGSVLVDPKSEVPEGHYAEESMKQTVVPNRNSIMLAIATGVAVAEGAEFVAAGMHAGDHFIYPDCRPKFVDAFNTAEQFANEGFWDGGIIAPFIEMTKADIVKVGMALGVPYDHTWSCYLGGAYHCGKCGTCVERKEAFEIAGFDDPTAYAE